ncbi:30S ribosomal protein S19 [Candidatus Undinarchaeota archaeon]
MPKEFTYRGKTLDELQTMPIAEFAQLAKSRYRRRLLSMTEEDKKVLKKLKTSRKPVKTHNRDLVIIPEMIGKVLMVYNGKSFVRLDIQPEMIGYRLGEFAQTRNRVSHSAPGMGATRSSKYVSLK